VAEIKTPTVEEIRAAALTLMRAWAPSVIAERQRSTGDDYDPYYNGCGCAGEDEDGEPYCNCAGGCSCPWCAHTMHAEAARCGLVVPTSDQPYARCGRPTGYRIVPFHPTHDGISRPPSDGDDAVDEYGYVKLGDTNSYGMTRYACSTQHARAVIEADRAYRARFDSTSALSAANTFYEVERWRYRPDDIGLERKFGDPTAGHLTTILSVVRSLEWAGPGLVVERWHGTHPDGARLPELAESLDWTVLLRSAAMLAEAIAELDTETLSRGLREDGDD